MTRVLAVACALALFPATSSAQVRVSAQLQKERYLRGEPVVAIVTITNGGPSELIEGVFCNDAVSITITGATRRPRPDLTFCPYSSIGPGCSGTGHPSILPPGEHRDFRFLVEGYDLRAGRYQVEISGELPWAFSRPRPTRGQGTPVSQRLSFEVVEASSDELRRALQPLLAEALGPSSPARFRAREALAEAAPPFLAKELATFAREQTPAAIDALRRIGLAESHAELRSLIGELREDQYVEWALKSLALFRDPADIPIIATIFHGGSARTWAAAAEALGWVGGDEAVRHLENAIAGASEETQDSIVRALGNTRSRLAGPALISRFGGGLESSVCSSLRVLTHRRWCNEMNLDPAAARRRMLREWQAAPGIPIYGPEDCAALEEEEKQYSQEQERLQQAAQAKFAAEVPRRPWPGPALITSLNPREPLANAPLHIEGYGIAVDDMKRVRIRFRNGATVHEVAYSGAGLFFSRDGVESKGYVSLTTPLLTVGAWQLEIVRDGNVVVSREIAIRAPPRLQLGRVQPSRPHPSQLVSVDASSVIENDRLELIDSKGKVWQLESFTSVNSFGFSIPEEVAEGPAAIIAYRKAGNSEAASKPLLVDITFGPSPLTVAALRYMTPVAPGEATALTPDTPDEFEIARADRIEIEFQQGRQRVVVETAGADRKQLTIPASLAPGDAVARSRTWIDSTVSEWSAPVRVRILKQPDR